VARKGENDLAVESEGEKYRLEDPGIDGRIEPSALEGLVRGFISSPLSFLTRLSSVDWSAWRSEKHGRSFLRFPLRERICLARSCFYSCFDLFVLGSTLRLYFCPGQERGAPSSAVFLNRDLRRLRGMSGR